MEQEQKDAKLPADYEELKQYSNQVKASLQGGRIQDLIVKKDSFFDDGWGSIECPQCGHCCAHIISIHTKDYNYLDCCKSKIISKEESLLDRYIAPNTENGVAIKMACEGGCDKTWTLFLVGHKGYIYFKCNIDE